MHAVINAVIYAIFLALLGIVWFKKGWKNALKIVGLFLVSSIASVVILTEVLGIKDTSSTFSIFALMLWVTWFIGIVIYISGFLK